MSKITLQIALDIEKQQVLDAIVTAFESKYSLWLGRIENATRPVKADQTGDWYDDPEVLDTGFEITYRVDDPDTGEDGQHSKSVVVNYAGILRGLELMAAKNLQVFEMLLSDMDAGSADSFWQYVTYGEEIYG